MIHGFSACPQQYFELADRVNRAGWRVLIPLLPGHGRQWVEFSEDDYSQLPTQDDWQGRWDALAEQLNELMQLANGPRVIVGFSFGGTTSLYINLKDRALYDRHLLLAPFFEPTVPWLTENALDVSVHVPGLKNVPLSAPTEISCLEKRASGYAGICEYQVKHLGALMAVSDQVRHQLEEAPLSIPLQVVWSQGDAVVSNDHIQAFVERQKSTKMTSVCHLDEEVAHQFMSRYEHPNRPTPWMDGLMDLAEGFITRGERQPDATGQASRACTD